MTEHDILETEWKESSDLFYSYVNQHVFRNIWLVHKIKCDWRALRGRGESSAALRCLGFYKWKCWYPSRTTGCSQMYNLHINQVTVYFRFYFLSLTKYCKWDLNELKWNHWQFWQSFLLYTLYTFCVSRLCCSTPFRRVMALPDNC